jgi:subtilisin-like proprotein convertase family protein
MANSALTKFSLMTAAIGAAWIAGGISAQAAIVGSNSTPGTFDSSHGSHNITFTGAEVEFGTGIIQDVNVSINFAKGSRQPAASNLSVGFPFFNEIIFHLISPSGTMVDLITPNSFGRGARGSQFDGTITFDDSAPQIVNVNPNMPQAGVFRPISPLSVLNGEKAAGTWGLFIKDTAEWDSLQVRSIQLNIQTQPTQTQPVPTPALLPGLLGLGVSIWRKRKGEAVPSEN